MKNTLIVLLLAGCAASTPPPSTSVPSTARDDDREILGVMDRYVSDPFGDPDAPKRIQQFVIASDAVLVQIDEKVAPWSGDDSVDGDTRARLLVAYTAGSAAAQLRSGRKGDDVHAGTAAALSVYRASKVRQPTLVSADLDKLAALEAKGELKAHLDAIAASRP